MGWERWRSESVKVLKHVIGRALFLGLLRGSNKRAVWEHHVHFITLTQNSSSERKAKPEAEVAQGGSSIALWLGLLYPLDLHWSESFCVCVSAILERNDVNSCLKLSLWWEFFPVRHLPGFLNWLQVMQMFHLTGDKKPRWCSGTCQTSAREWLWRCAAV